MAQPDRRTDDEIVDSFLQRLEDRLAATRPAPKPEADAEADAALAEWDDGMESGGAEDGDEEPHDGAPAPESGARQPGDDRALPHPGA